MKNLKELAKKPEPKVQSKYTESFVPIKSIANGMIVLDDNVKVTGLKIQPKNIFILDSSSQEAVISNLRNVYNVINYEFWLIIAGRPVDINVYLSQLQIAFNSTPDQKIKKMIMEDINKANMFMSIGVVDTEFYLLFKDKDNDVLQKRLRTLINQFASAGLNTSQTTNDDLRVLLDNFLNAGMRTEAGTVMS